MKREACDDREDAVLLRTLGMLPAREAAEVDQHVATCAPCRDRVEWARSTADAMGCPLDLACSQDSAWAKLAQRIAADGGPVLGPLSDAPPAPAWQNPGPGIECTVLSRHQDSELLTMLVRLAPGADYPPHVHSGVEELYLLSGELWINEDRLLPGAYNRAEPGTRDRRVWSATGCTCLLITSANDRIA